MRAAVLLFALVLLGAYGLAERERRAAVEAAREATLAEVERVLAESSRLLEEHAGSANSILRPLPVMTPGEEARLRRHLGTAHVARARELGARVTSRALRDSLLAAGRLVQLEDSTRHWIVRERTSPAYVVPELRALLEVVGTRFQARLAEMGLPPYRFEVTSATRTSARQARLRRSNANAAAGVSSHEFGTTVDVSYAAFAPPLEVPERILAGVPEGLRPHMERVADLALESVSARKSHEMSAIFSRVLAEAQTEGIALVIYERQQTIYHLTVGVRVVPVE